MKTSFSSDIAASRAEVAAQLRALADAIEGDEAVEMELNGMEVEFDLPEPVTCTLELELDSEGECELEIEISWNHGDEDESDEDEDEDEEDDEESADEAPGTESAEG